MVGKVLSLTVIVCGQDKLTFPQLSVTVHVRVTLVMGFGQLLSVITSIYVAFITPQASVMVPPAVMNAAPVTSTAVDEYAKEAVPAVIAVSLHPSIFRTLGGQVITGAVRSEDETIFKQVELQPLASVTVTSRR